MNVYIFVDMEGISGVSNSEFVMTSGRHYAESRRYYTDDLNACVRGCFAGGAQAVTESASGDPAASTPVIQSEAMTATAYAYQATASGVTTTTLPNTGFWDEVGIPVMLGGAALLVMVIILVRRLRLSN